jgi:N-acetylmuramoyl-L-alanine amidase
MRQIKYIIIHCSATKAGQDFCAKDIKKWHLERGFSDIGYHKIIDLNGTVEPGRSEEIPGAHCKGYNANSIGICYIGGLDENGKPADTRTEAQKKSLLKLIKSYKLRFPNAKVVGHRDMPNVHKACPCFDAKKEYENI